jgi:hypothetical protein
MYKSVSHQLRDVTMLTTNPILSYRILYWHELLGAIHLPLPNPLWQPVVTAASRPHHEIRDSEPTPPPPPPPKKKKYPHNTNLICSNRLKTLSINRHYFNALLNLGLKQLPTMVLVIPLAISLPPLVTLYVTPDQGRNLRGGGVWGGWHPHNMRIIRIGSWAIKMRKIAIKLNKLIMSTILNVRM